MLDFAMGVSCRCALCGAVLPERDLDTGICRSCLEEMAGEMSNTCRICGVPLPAGHRLCAACRVRAYWFDSIRTAGTYRGKLKEAIIRMKYRGERSLKRPLGKLLAGVAMRVPAFDVVVPVPADPVHRRKRGFDQGRDLALEVGRWLDVPVRFLLEKAESALPVTGLSKDDRWRESKELLRPARSPGDLDLRGLGVLLVDDVVTTGATVNAASRVLKMAGASRVHVAALARTPVEEERP